MIVVFLVRVFVTVKRHMYRCFDRDQRDHCYRDSVYRPSRNVGNNDQRRVPIDLVESVKCSISFQEAVGGLRTGNNVVSIKVIRSRQDSNLRGQSPMDF